MADYFIDREGTRLDRTLKKVDGIEEGAQKNKIDSISVNGEVQPVGGKNVNITVPTGTRDLTNNAGFVSQYEMQSADEDALKQAKAYAESKVNNHEAKVVEEFRKVEQKLSGVEQTVKDSQVIEHVNVNGVNTPITNKTVHINIPRKLSELENDLGLEGGEGGAATPAFRAITDEMINGLS